VSVLQDEKEVWQDVQVTILCVRACVCVYAHVCMCVCLSYGTVVQDNCLVTISLESQVYVWFPSCCFLQQAETRLICSEQYAYLKATGYRIL